MAEMSRVRHPEDESDDDADDLSDLEDFIVCKPGRDYSRLIASEFRYTAKESQYAD
jgi:hypothetical protein